MAFQLNISAKVLEARQGLPGTGDEVTSKSKKAARSLSRRLFLEGQISDPVLAPANGKNGQILESSTQSKTKVIQKHKKQFNTQ